MANTLLPNQVLGINEYLLSTNGAYQLILQSDGNLVLYRMANHHPLWASNTNGKDAMRAIMQTDGNFVLYDFHGKPLWASGTNGKPGCFVTMQDDGNLVIYEPKIPVWASNTAQ
ncbi:D-mannose binding lectin [Chromobacterium violaceum]|uniref:D-mannose binding lectin n=1 Tax=Chromobacterium violaceum TaxID=536 RepID=A0A202B9K5_CHRVL|nr:hypothetical protein [Chromobacterium violaceum]ATP29486.1 lectin [Chromobacterium violaceum]ATP33391.1 lectin [Chromobacterium violaceum]KJH68859.1 hypothetical protein UF16_02530 [Chromobacterium violaceum]KMN47649.1 hypothetical protein VK93_20195 [Chromobacterium violaceum]KMN85850.1 hypothetical protein VL02_12315 [Chromobacterium violaceum]